MNPLPPRKAATVRLPAILLAVAVAAFLSWLVRSLGG